MHLIDQRLNFAKELISHWSDIRGSDLVPTEIDLDLHELQRILPTLSIMDTPTPNASIVVVMGEGRLPRDLWPTVKDANWYDLIAPEARDIAVRARKGIIETPCGVYYHYTASGADNFSQEAEALVLPLRIDKSQAPSVTISVTNMIRRRGKQDLSRRARLGKLQWDYVDIGAGIPEKRLNGS
jgi:hypothetical protein